MSDSVEPALQGSSGNGPKVMMYSHDGFGLGHLRRNLNIANRLTRRLQGASVLLVAGLPGIPGLELDDGVDLMKLPSIRKADTEVWEPRTLRISCRRLGDIRRASLLAVAEELDPDLLVVDHLPGGVWGELLPTLRWLRDRPRPARVVLGLRDILDEPEVTRRVWTENGYYELIREYYDRVMIYGSPVHFDTARHYNLSRRLPGLVEYCGYLCSEPATGEPRRIHEDLGLERHERLILVAGGGGLDSFPVMELSLRAADLLGNGPRLRWVLVAGPLMNYAKVAELKRRADGLPVEVVRFSESMPELLGAADVIVTMGGYNSVMEAVGARKPIVVVPRQGPSAEQRIRSDVFSKLGLLKVVRPEAPPSALAEAVVESLGSSGGAQTLVDTDGLSKAVDSLVALVASVPSARVDPGSIRDLRDLPVGGRPQARG